jgi:hypothetical protein
MSWQCSSCGETHDDAFDSCWRCSAARLRTASERAEDEREAQADVEAAAVEEAELQRQDAIAAYQEAAGWYRPPLGDRAAEAGMVLHRLVVAYRLYRQRQGAGVRGSRPDLDRLWTHFFLACSVLGGIAVSTFTPFAWLEYLAPNASVFTLVYVGALLVCVITGRRAVSRELRAAAEAAVTQGRRPVQRVT